MPSRDGGGQDSGAPEDRGGRRRGLAGRRGLRRTLNRGLGRPGQLEQRVEGVEGSTGEIN